MSKVQTSRPSWARSISRPTMAFQPSNQLGFAEFMALLISAVPASAAGTVRNARNLVSTLRHSSSDW